MCTVSMIMDHYYDKWYQRAQEPFVIKPWTTPQPVVPQISAAEIAEFRELLERARRYDREHNQPDCELDEKKRKIKDLARLLGVDVSFVDTVPSGAG